MALPHRCVAAAVAGLGLASHAFALDGATPLEITPIDIAGPNWRILELYTHGNSITSIADAGYTQKGKFDGIGAYAHDANTVRVFLNHELDSASVSYLDLNTTNLKNWLAAPGTTAPAGQVVKKMGQAYTSISGGSDAAQISRLCSSTLFEPNRYGANRGFASRTYMTGEELGGGSIYALDPATRTMHQCTALPLGSWENVGEFDTGRTDKLGLLLFEDAGSNLTTGSAPLRMWIGNKSADTGATFLEKNGLASGQVYYWIPSGAGTSALARFTATDQSLTGTWSTSPSGAMLFSKLEDGAISPHSGTLAAFNVQDQGTFTADLAITFNQDGSLNAGSATVKLLLEHDDLPPAPVVDFDNQDNLTWSTANLLFTQEDGDNQEIWQINPSTLDLDRDALAIARVTGGAGESSGIVDVSALFGYVPGSILLTDSQADANIADNQLVLMLSPTAALVPEPGAASLLGAALMGMLGRRRRRRI